MTSVTLRKPDVRDAHDALDMLLDPAVVQWNPAPDVVDLASAIEWCRRGADWSSGDHATFHAVDEVTGRLLANVSVHAIEVSSRTARIGYRVAPWARRRGVGRTAVDAVARWSFWRLAIERLDLVHDLPNVDSCRLARSAGFALVGESSSVSCDASGAHGDEHVHCRRASHGAERAVTAHTILDPGDDFGSRRLASE